MSQITIYLPNDRISEIEKLEKVLDEKIQIAIINFIEGHKNLSVTLRCPKKMVPKVLKVLNEIGIGTKFGIIDIIKLETTIPELKEKDQDISEEITSRISVEEIKFFINKVANLNLDFYVFIVLSAVIAAAGLILNSTAITIGSMIISPLLGPILGVSYGITKKKYHLVKNGILGQLSGIIIAIVIGLILGLLSSLIQGDPSLTQEMMARNFPTIFDLIVSFSAGIAVGFAITGRIQASLVGIAIALSLMPPAVNIGVALSYGASSLSLGSFTLLISNILLINITAIFIFKLKKVVN